MMRLKEIEKYLKNIIKKTFLYFLVLFFSITASFGQIPQGVPKPQDNDPVAFNSLSDVIIYVILPALLIIIYLFILYRQRKRRRKEDQESARQEKEINR
ncbi:MAG: hypothetical protein KFF73_10520 [Cyclobacteriaceae bacterium]|nr:hypothetical protein [Cyclobacteriaceae bacterium]